ncbi:MAG TPA: hypothetical protein VGT05_02785 [Patescibacteria group bacterium]|nr:hypothetical protein [Patescibacteria group bacterium]
MVSPLSTTLDNKEISIAQTVPITFDSSRLVQLIMYVNAGISIASTFINPEKPLLGNEEEIISQIHKLRYNAQAPYLITGSHFHQSYVRNRGIFSNALLDPRISSTEQDWQQKQAIALKTIALDLEVFRLAQRDYTTIVQLGGNKFTAINIYARPSDSLFSILYTLSALTDPLFLPQVFPTPSPVKTVHSLNTVSAAKKLILAHKSGLKLLVENYLSEVLDTQTGLVRKNIHLSSARDGIKRISSFYDNVIAWATCRLAKDLRIDEFNRYNLQKWKRKLITEFWDDKNGTFKDDLSQNNLLFSADAFIVTSSGFLQTNNAQDRNYLFKMIAYVQKNKLDHPFPLHYSKANEPKKLYWPVRVFAPSYMGESIWSHWGIEYIKTLILLSPYNPEYLKEARRYLAAYKQNIVRYGGYPELYDARGRNFKNRLYKSVLHNSWIINYEQAKMLLEYYSSLKS